jgi:hypothetical protein
MLSNLELFYLTSIGWFKILCFFSIFFQITEIKEG